MIQNPNAVNADLAGASGQDRCVSEPLHAIGLTRDVHGMCVVTFNGREVIRDNGDVISHYANVAHEDAARRRSCLRLLLIAVQEVTAWDWSDNDRECVADMASLAEIAGRIERWMRNERDAT